jgi:hypothetical protein
MTTKQHTAHKAGRGARKNIKPPLLTHSRRHGLMVHLGSYPETVREKVDCIKTLIEAAQIANDCERAPSMLKMALGIINALLAQLDAKGGAR